MKLMSIGTSRLATAAVTLGVAASTVGATAVLPAEAAADDRRCVVPPSAYVRNYPRGAAWSQLYAGQTFGVYEYRASGWARGFAYGQLNTDRSPYVPGWDYSSFPAAYDVWIQEDALGKHVNDGSTC